jgi:predicted exporter
MRRAARTLLLWSLWIASLAVLGVLVRNELSIGADLRLFLPSPTTADQRLVLDLVGEGPAARVLVIALEGASAERLADASRALAAALRGSEHFRLVSNGEVWLDELPDELVAYRFLLSPTLDRQAFDRDYLHEQLKARARDLASTASILIEPWLARDPTLELLKVVEQWQPTREPRRAFDVWFDRDETRALLVAQTSAPAFDPDRERAAIVELEQAFRTVSADQELAMTISGAGMFSVLMEARTREEAKRLSQVAAIGMIALLLIAYRRPSSVLLSALPLLSAGLAALAAVSVLFGTVHAITLAFGFTLIGVAQDYPLHLLSHRRADLAPREVARRLWPTLATGVASTCIAYLTFLFSGVTGLAQLGVFAVVGLAVAGLTTRFVLPSLMSPDGPDFARSERLGRISRSLTRLSRPRWIGVALLGSCATVLGLAPGSFWNDDLRSLTPVPEDLQAQDRDLREQLGTADLRHILAVDAPSSEAALVRLETLEPWLQSMVARGILHGYDHAARYLPSAATQRSRQSRLPDPESLRADLESLEARLPFRASAFNPFIDDVAQARMFPPLTLDDARASTLGASLEMLMTEQQGHTTALVTLSGVSDAAAIRELAASAPDDVRLLDLTEAAQSLIAGQRTRILWSLGIASVLLTAVVAFALRNRVRVMRVLTPMALTTLVVIAVLQAAGISLNLFHLMSLILAGGLGLDYALFFERAADDAAEQRRTLHAVLVCAISTFLVFALLASSTLPVLRAIGLPVAIGTISNFVLALLITQHGIARDATTIQNRVATDRKREGQNR